MEISTKTRTLLLIFFFIIFSFFSDFITFSNPVYGVPLSDDSMIPRDVVAGKLGEKLDLYLTRIVPYGFSGALLVEKDGQVVLNKGYGIAIRSGNISNTSNTVFSTGSITKQFTAAAIMKLETLGKLNTSDTLGKYLDNVPEDKIGITLFHLLTHTSGVVDAVGYDYEKLEREDLVKRVFKEPLQFKPGEEFAYSNAGYSLLAAIVEKVSGLTYEKFLKKNLLIPAGMDFTGYRLPDWTKKVVAHWYVGDKDNGIPLDKPYPYWNLVGNGGILSTTEDMLRWHHALLTEKVLPEAAKKKMFTPYLNDYGYGWDVLRDERGLLIQHDGGSMLGNSAEMRRYIDAGIVTILFCNQSYGQGTLMEVVRDKIEILALGGDIPIPSAVVETKDNVLEKYTGIYLLSGKNMLKVEKKNQGLLVKPEGQKAVNALFMVDKEKGDLYDLYNNWTVNVMVPALSGDYEDFSQILYDKERRLEPVRELISMRLKRYKPRTGEITKVYARVTLPAVFRGQEAAQTFVELKGDKGSIFFILYWKDKLNVGLAPVMAVPDLAVPFYFQSENKFAGYHLEMAKDFSIIFEATPEGKITGLSVPFKSGKVVAKKQ